MWVGFAIVSLVCVAAALAVKVTPHGRNHLVQRLGRHHRTLAPGVHVITPLIDQVAHDVGMAESALPTTSHDVATSDRVAVALDIAAYIQVVEASLAIYQVDDVRTAVSDLIAANLRATIAASTLEELLDDRDAIVRRVRSAVEQSARRWGVKVTRLEVIGLTPPARLVEAAETELAAEQEARAELRVAETRKAAAITRADGEREAAIRVAEGRRRAAFLNAEAHERDAQADAQAARLIGDVVGPADGRVLSYLLNRRAIGVIEHLVQSDQHPITAPAEMAALAAELGGFGEVMRNEKAGARPAQEPRDTIPSSPLPPADPPRRRRAAAEAKNGAS